MFVAAGTATSTSICGDIMTCLVVLLLRRRDVEHVYRELRENGQPMTRSGVGIVAEPNRRRRFPTTSHIAAEVQAAEQQNYPIM